MLQIEHRDAVANIESIVAVEGIDGLFIGPYDLSASMGKPGVLDDAEVRAAIETVETHVLATGLPLGIFVASPEAASPYIRKGYRLITVGTDALLLAEAAKNMLSAIQR